MVDSKIYAIGGQNSSGALNSVEVYDPTTNAWTTKAPMTFARYSHQIAVVDGKIYAIGGYDGSSILNSVEVYDPTTNTWISKAPMNNPRYYHQVVVSDGKIYAIGGFCGSILSSTEVYDPTTDTWTTKASMFVARYYHQIAVVGGKIYAIGGYDNNIFLNSVEVYDPVANTWKTKAPMSTARYSHKAIVAGGRIYATGGYGNSSIILDSVEVYDPVADTWTTKEPMSTARSNHEAAFAGGNIYAIGGLGGDISYLNSVEAYTVPNAALSLEVTSVSTARVGNEITADVVIHNAVNICAEDIKIAFDTTRLDFIGIENVNGIKIYKEDDLTNGVRRYITASLGKTNAANGEKILLKLKFTAKAAGDATIEIISGRIADNATLEADVDQANCGKKIISIIKDVNRTGEFTLLDLGIDAWYYGDAAADTDTTRYDADVVANGLIDDNDLVEIVEQMLVNANYPM